MSADNVYLGYKHRHLRCSLVQASLMAVCCSPCYTSVIHCFRSLTSRILFWELLHCFSRFYSYRIQTCALKAASYLTWWIVRSHMQHAIEIGSSCNRQVSQGSVETYLRWGGGSLWCMCAKVPQESDSERILLICLHFPNLLSYYQKSSYVYTSSILYFCVG